jgi:hypothetical protein
MYVIDVFHRLHRTNWRKNDFRGGGRGLGLGMQMKKIEVQFILWSISTRRLYEDGKYPVVGAF